MSAEDSPTGKPLLIVGSAVSGTTTIWEIDLVPNVTTFSRVPTLENLAGN